MVINLSTNLARENTNPCKIFNIFFMKKTLILFCAFFCFFGLVQLVHSADIDPFTFAVLGDIQGETQAYPSVLDSECQWIVDNASSNNIQAVFSMGDLTENTNDAEFQIARTNCFDKLKTAGIVNIPTMGNHDYDTMFLDSSRDDTFYNEYFGASYFAGDSWYVANYNGDNANYYSKFTVGTRRFLVLDLEFFPLPATVAWANSIINANPSYEIIVVTHAYLKETGTLFQHDDLYGPETYGLSADSSSGQDLWDNLISNTTNVRAVLSGHDICSPNYAFIPATTTSGSVVNQLFTNYQCADNGGDGWVGLLTLDTSAETGTMEYYRTYAPSGLGYDATTFLMSWPTVADTTLPTVDDFTLPVSVQNSLTISVSSFVATDDIGVTDYLLTESSTAPTPEDSGWSSSVPTIYTFSTPGDKTLYAWVKDAAGNVSISLSASVSIVMRRSARTSGSYIGHTVFPSILTTPIIPTINDIPAKISYNFGTTILRNGSSGNAVKELQRFLNQVLNLNLVVDGRLGPKTVAVIKKWQRLNELVVDGLVGPKTKAKMNAVNN